MADNKTQIVITAKDETKAAFTSAENGMRGLAAHANSLTGGLGGVQSAATTLIPVLGGLGAAFSIAKFAETISSTIKFAAALDDMAERTGASVENLSALSGVARIGGHDLGMVETSVIKLNKALHGSDDEAKGAAKAIAAIGLSVEDLRQKDPAQAMLDIAKALDKFSDGGGKSAAAMAILGKSGAQALPFLKDLAEKSELVGKVTAEQAAQAEVYEKNLAKLSGQMGAFGKTVALEVLPVLERLTSALLTDISSAGGFFNALKIQATLPWGNLSEQIGKVSTEVERLQKLQKGTGAAAEDFKSLGGEAALQRALQTKKYLQARQITQTLEQAGDPASNMDANDRKFARKLSLDSFDSSATKPDKPTRTGGGGGAKIDEAERLLATMRERIALNELDAQSVDKMTSVEKEAAKVKLQLEFGTLKATAAQKAAIIAGFDQLATQEKTLKAQEEYRRGVEQLEQTNARQRQFMIDQTAALEASAKSYGLSESAISSEVAARLEDAIAITSQNKGMEEQTAFLEEELARRNKLTDALEANTLARLLNNTETAKAKKTEADVAILDRALSGGKIDQKQYDEAISGIKEKTDELGEFMKQAAKNMQDAMADFFINPTADGMQSIADGFGKAVQKMIAQAAAAQLGKLLFGDLDKNGQMGGWIGKLLGAFGSSGGSSLGSGAFDAIFSNPALFANGGIMTSAGPMPLKSYAGGGIANTPQLSLFGEGRTPEAYVPLPDGRRIPVHMQGGGDSPNITVHVNSQTGDPAEIRRSAAAGARTALGLMSSSRRYA